MGTPCGDTMWEYHVEIYVGTHVGTPCEDPMWGYHVETHVETTCGDPCRNPMWEHMWGTMWGPMWEPLGGTSEVRLEGCSGWGLAFRDQGHRGCVTRKSP